VDEPLGEVDVGPAERKQLAEAQAGECGDGEDAPSCGLSAARATAATWTGVSTLNFFSGMSQSER